jgi:putative DNA primase/helicase
MNDTQLGAALNFGLLVDSIEQDEQLHRIATQLKPKGKNGWYVAYGDLLIMGDWLTGITETWKPEGHQRSLADRRLIREAIDGSKQQKLSNQRQAALNARAQYQQAKQVAVHPYLSNKGISSPDSLRLSGKWLLVPLYDVMTNELVNLQRIAPDGTKLFSKGGQITGAGCPICLDDKPIDQIFICEGYATAASIHHMTSKPVIAAMNAGNILPVAKAVKKRWPRVDIVIAGDDDWLTEQELGFNSGKDKSIEAAHIVGAKVSFPPFTLEEKKSGLTDWNDYYLAYNNKVVA